LQPLDPIAFQLGPIAVHWYGIIMGSAVFIGLWLAMREAKRQGLNPDIFIDLVMWALRSSYLVHECIMWSSNGIIIVIIQ
jgi:phosphatidylglycerol:prolipoprotein diacylglycerol transferase